MRVQDLGWETVLTQEYANTQMHLVILMRVFNIWWPFRLLILYLQVCFVPKRRVLLLIL